MKKEIRTIKTPVTVEKREDGTIKSIVGYPIVYNSDSEDMGFIERIAPGAATKALKKSDVRGLKNHDASLIFARTGVNLTLTEDKDGVRMEATPLDTFNFRETAKEVDLGLLDGQSFAFNILADEWKDLDKAKPQRTITEFEMIYDVGPVTYPAYPDTTVGLRTLEEAREAAKDIIPAQNETITIEIDEERFDFTGEARFDDAAEKIKSLRSDAKPTFPDSDNLDPDPTIITDEVVKDETLDKINAKIKEYEK